MLARFLFWRLAGLVALLPALSLASWFASGGVSTVLRGAGPAHPSRQPGPARLILAGLSAPLRWAWDGLPLAGVPLCRLVVLAAVLVAGVLLASRTLARGRRRYVRLRVGAYRTDRAEAEALVAMYEAIHKRLLARWWRRLLLGQPSVAVEVHLTGPAGAQAWLAVACPAHLRDGVEAAVRAAYPNARLLPVAVPPTPHCLLRLKKRSEFIRRLTALERLEQEPLPVDRLITVMAAGAGPALVQLALTPAPVAFERWARILHKRHQEHLEDGRGRGWRRPRPASEVDRQELRGGLAIQHRALFFADLRVIAQDRRSCERIASELRAQGAENRLVERRAAVRQGLLHLYRRRMARGEGNPLPGWHRGVLASAEPHYLRQAQRYLGHELRALRAAQLETSLAALVHHLDPIQLEVLARRLPEDQSQPLFAYLDSLGARQVRDLSGVRDRLAVVAESDAGPWLEPRAGVEAFDVLAAIRRRAVVYFRLDADRRPLLAQMLGAAVVQDLITAVAALQGRPVPTVVAIDEFSALAAGQVARLFGRARSAGISLVLGTQELSDLRTHADGALLERVLGNVGAIIAHRQLVPQSADLIAGVAGTQGAWIAGHRTSGDTSYTRVREYAIHPDLIKGLAPGWAAVVVPGTGTACLVQVLSTRAHP